MSTPLSIRLPPDIDEILKESASGSRPDFVAALIRRHRQRALSTLIFLRDAGWTIAELRAALEALHGVDGLDRPDFIAAELEEADRVTGLAARHGVSASTWAQRVADVHRDPVLGARLLELAGLVATGDAWLTKRLE